MLFEAAKLKLEAKNHIPLKTSSFISNILELTHLVVKADLNELAKKLEQKT